MSQKSQAVPSHRAFRNTSYHLPNKITHNTICPPKKKGGTSREERMYVSAKKKRGKGRESRKKKRKRTAKSLGVVCERDKDKGEDKKTEEDRGPR